MENLINNYREFQSAAFASLESEGFPSTSEQKEVYPFVQTAFEATRYTGNKAVGLAWRVFSLSDDKFNELATKEAKNYVDGGIQVWKEFMELTSDCIINDRSIIEELRKSNLRSDEIYIKSLLLA